MDIYILFPVASAALASRLSHRHEDARSCGGRRAAAERESEREREAEMRDDGPRPDRRRRAAAGLAAVDKLLACAAAHCHAKWRGR